MSVFVCAAWAAEARPLTQEFTAPVAEDDGDMISTSQVAVSSFSATLIDVGISSNTYNDSLRRRIIKNDSGFQVYVGISTPTLLTTGFQIDPSTGTMNNYQTYSNASIYGTCNSVAGSCTVSLMKETSANP